MTRKQKNRLANSPKLLTSRSLLFSLSLNPALTLIHTHVHTYNTPTHDDIYIQIPKSNTQEQTNKQTYFSQKMKKNKKLWRVRERNKLIKNHFLPFALLLLFLPLSLSSRVFCVLRTISLYLSPLHIKNSASFSCLSSPFTSF